MRPLRAYEITSYLPLYIARILHRNSSPTWLLRQSTWKNGKRVKTTLSNLTKVPHEFRMQIRALCRGGIVVRDVLGYFKEVYLSAQSAPHGPVAATLGTLRKLKRDQLISARTPRYSIWLRCTSVQAIHASRGFKYRAEAENPIAPRYPCALLNK